MGSTTKTDTKQTYNATQAQTQTPTNPSWVTQPLQSMASTITSLGSVPATSYVAPQTALQTQANTQGAATLGGTDPNFDKAAGMFSGNSSLSPSSIQSYLNPYTNDVVNSTNKLFDQYGDQQRMALEAQGAASGAFGGSRFGVAQGMLGGQLALDRGNLDANLLSHGYDTATQTALGNAQLGQNAATGLSNIATSKTASNIANLEELSQLGGAQQATAQAQATAPIALAQAMDQLYAGDQFGLFNGSTGTMTGSGNSTSNTTQTTNDPLKELSGIFGGLGSLASGAGSLVTAFAPVPA